MCICMCINALSAPGPPGTTPGRNTYCITMFLLCFKKFMFFLFFFVFVVVIVILYNDVYDDRNVEKGC